MHAISYLETIICASLHLCIYQCSLLFQFSSEYIQLETESEWYNIFCTFMHCRHRHLLVSFLNAQFFFFCICVLACDRSRRGGDGEGASAGVGADQLRVVQRQEAASALLPNQPRRVSAAPSAAQHVTGERKPVVRLQRQQ